MELAYLTTVYPRLSHTFIEREVRTLRSMGVKIETLAVRPSEDSDSLSEHHRQALDSTWSLRPDALPRLPWAHARALARAPFAYLRTLALTVRISPGGARALVWQLFYFAQAIALWDHLERTPIRHIHVHFSNVSADLALLACAYGGPGWSWSLTVHGSTEFYDVRRFNVPEKIRRARFVVCISDFCRAQVSRCVEPAHWGKLTIVHCGVDVDEYRPLGSAEPADGVLDVLCVGRLVPDKGLTILLRSIAALAERGHDLRATLVGNGDEGDGLLRLAAELGIADRVRLPGAVGQDHIRALYARADIFCLPSFAEGVPVVLMEAMAMEIPVVATGIMGVPELVEHERTGLLVRPANVQSLTDAIARLAADPELRERLGRAGRAKVVQEFDITASAGQLREVFASHLSDAQSAGEPETVAGVQASARRFGR